MKRVCIILILMIVSAYFCISIRAGIADTIDVCVQEHQDSLTFKVTTYDIETQLTFLMQGLTIRVNQPDTLTLTFPSAPMVRHKVKRHPNEVKAAFSGTDSIHQVVRPDVLPLVAALNDTTAHIHDSRTDSLTHGFQILVNRENAIMTFLMSIPHQLLKLMDSTLSITLCSQPLSFTGLSEFRGRRLSNENALRPNGMGEGLTKESASSRMLNKTMNIYVSNN